MKAPKGNSMIDTSNRPYIPVFASIYSLDTIVEDLISNYCQIAQANSINVWYVHDEGCM